MSRYSIKRREWVLRQMMPPANQLVAGLAEDTGILVTLYARRKQAGAAGELVPGDGKNPRGWSTEEKFRAVLEIIQGIWKVTAHQRVAESGGNCRARNGAGSVMKSVPTSLKTADRRARIASCGGNISVQFYVLEHLRFGGKLC